MPSVVRTYAPVGQTHILREWWTRDHLSAISAIFPEGKVYFYSQDHAINSDDVVAFLTHLLREVLGRMVIIGDGSPIHRSHVIQEFLANGAEHRMHLERLPLCPRAEPRRRVLGTTARRRAAQGLLPPSPAPAQRTPRYRETRATKTADHPRLFQRGRTLDHCAPVSKP